ncbi:MAG: response regulator [Chloroflexi bacterium]|nr:response regulator [Chloroflexota bacterium]
MDPILIIALVVSVVLLVVLSAISLRRRRRTPKAPRTKGRGKVAPVPTTLSAEDEQLLETLGGTKRVIATPAAEAPSPKPAPETPVSKIEGPLKPINVAPLSPRSGSRASAEHGKIRILVVDDNKDTRDNVSRLIAFEPDMEVVGQAFNGKQAVDEAINLRPHIVLMDINMPDMDGIQATREMVVRAPYSQIIIMSVQFETDYMRAAMLAGARDYQTKPFSADELVNCIRRVYDIGRPIYQKLELADRSLQPTEVAVVAASTAPINGATTPVLMVYSPKGGTGKTAMAINLAAALRRDLDSVTLLDADLQMGDLPIDLNIRPAATLTELIASSRPDPALLPSILQAHSSGINVLFAPQKPELSELITGNMMIQVVRAVKTQTRAVVVDTASYLTDHNLALVEAATDVLLVITPDLPSVKNAKMFLELAPDVGLKPDQIALVINRATMPGAIPALQIERALKLTRVYAIPDDPKMRLALIKGVSIFQLDAASPSAVAMETMAKAIWQRQIAPPVLVEMAPPTKSAAAAAK